MRHSILRDRLAGLDALEPRLSLSAVVHVLSTEPDIDNTPEDPENLPPAPPGPDPGPYPGPNTPLPMPSVPNSGPVGPGT